MDCAALHHGCPYSQSTACYSLSGRSGLAESVLFLYWDHRERSRWPCVVVCGGRCPEVVSPLCEG